MSVSEEQIQAFAGLIAQLYERVLLTSLPEGLAYRSYLDGTTPFGLDDDGYRTSYLGLLQSVFHLPNIVDKWSEDGIQELGHDLLLDLADTKRQQRGAPDFTSIAHNWLAKIDVEFGECVCYTAVAGLSVEAPLEVGTVTFLPLDVQRPEFDDELAVSFRDELNSFRDSLSTSKVTAEWRRASQLHREKTETALNVLRFIGALVWHDRPTPHIYIASQDPKRVSDTLVVTTGGAVSRVGASDFTPVPFRVDQQTIQYAEFYGLREVQALLKTSSQSEIQQSYLTSIQWFGQATQELLPLVAFVKYYIAIETALKRAGENAKTVLPRRLGVLIEPWNRSRFAKLEADLRDFIDERNAVFHSGTPKAQSAEELQWESRILARQALHQLRLRLKSEHWRTKDDLIAWVDTQHSKFLQ